MTNEIILQNYLQEMTIDRQDTRDMIERTLLGLYYKKRINLKELNDSLAAFKLNDCLIHLPTRVRIK